MSGLPAAAAGAPGTVSLVGAGPGDPELLTVRALRRLAAADVVVHDRLVGAAILALARPDARLVAVGKASGGPSVAQDEINRILVSEALGGAFVVRLKGGDPYVFGRGAEEQAALVAAGVPVEVVPGITAAVGCAAAIGLPLTARGRNRGVALVTGMTGQGPARHEWQALARAGLPFALYMGVATAAHTQACLVAAGIDPDTPVVIVENGTLPGQRSLETVVGSLAGAIAAAAVKGPAVVYVGIPPVAGTRTARVDLPAPGAEVVPFPGPARPGPARRARA